MNKLAQIKEAIEKTAKTFLSPKGIDLLKPSPVNTKGLANWKAKQLAKKEATPVANKVIKPGTDAFKPKQVA